MSDYQFKDLIDLGNGMAYYSNITPTVKTEYFCVPDQPGLGITERWWKIMKVTTDLTSTDKDLAQGKAIMFAGWTPDFTFLATDYTYVAGLSYS